MQLDPLVAAQGVHLIALAAVGSTNSAALTRARDGERASVWMTAEQQTGGRGRRGRGWQSPPGNLYASLLLSDPCRPADAPQLSFVAALALHDAVCACAPALGARLRLKWPNDLLLDGAKVAGILVEGETLTDGRFAVVIGIGLNCASHPHDLPYRATDLSGAGAAATPPMVFRALSRTMAERLTAWRGGRGFDAIRNDWAARAHAVGEPIAVGPPASAEGAFAGIDAEGRLMLRTASGAIQVYAAGDVRAALDEAVS